MENIKTKLKEHKRELIWSGVTLAAVCVTAVVVRDRNTIKEMLTVTMDDTGKDEIHVIQKNGRGMAFNPEPIPV